MGRDIDIRNIRKLKRSPVRFARGTIPVGHSWYSFDTNDLK